MNGKAFLWILALGAILGIVRFVQYNHELDDLKQQLADVETLVHAADSTNAPKTKALEQKKEENSVFAKVTEELSKATQERDALAKQLDDVERQPERIAARVSEMVETIRKKNLGRSIGDLKLPSGVVLRNARIDKISDTVVTISHAEGLAKLDVRTAPPEMVVHFRLKAPVGTESSLGGRGASGFLSSAFRAGGGASSVEMILAPHS